MWLLLKLSFACIVYCAVVVRFYTIVLEDKFLKPLNTYVAIDF